MGSFRFELRLGEYSEPVYVNIDLRVEGGLEAQDYTTVREALDTIEEVMAQYPKNKVNVPDDL